jgi:mRNA interferase YafQ
MPKYKTFESALYKKTRKLAQKRGLDLSLLRELLNLLENGEPLPAKYRDHQLKGKLSELRECHVQDDWLLIYCVFEDTLVLSLHSTGFHADLFE